MRIISYAVVPLDWHAAAFAVVMLGILHVVAPVPANGRYNLLLGRLARTIYLVTCLLMGSMILARNI